MTTDGHGVSFWSEENVLDLLVRVEHLAEYTLKATIVHFKKRLPILEIENILIILEHCKFSNFLRLTAKKKIILRFSFVSTF